jgi:hypothetical protein
MLLLTVTFAGDIVHPDSIAPKKPGCDNNFVLVQFYKYLGQKKISTCFQFCFFIASCTNVILIAS